MSEETAAFSPGVSRKLLHFEDQQDTRRVDRQDTLKVYGFSKDRQLEPNDIAPGFESGLTAHILRLDTPSTNLTFQTFNMASRDALLSSSIMLFGEIFTSQSLNIKNKQQLLKHFIVHSTLQAAQAPPTKDKKAQPASPAITPNKVAKVIQIGLAVLAVCKMHAKKAQEPLD